jgi:hypothetical protein
MRNSALAATALTALILGGSSGERAEAAQLAAPGLGAAVDPARMIETVQFYWDGRRYCWYRHGWHGPGFYRCGYAWRHGHGWGGPMGWHGWYPDGAPGGPAGPGGPPPGPGWGPPGPGWGPGGPHHGPGGGHRPGPGGGLHPGPGGWPPGGPGAAASDLRLKRDVVELTRLDNGLGLYRYRYVWSNQLYVGVMAQEVMGMFPEAVVRGPDGYLRVDYPLIGRRLMTWEEWLASPRRQAH